MRTWVYRFGIPGMALCAFLAMSYLHQYGDRGLYEDILRSSGIVPFRLPFVDLYAVLSVWECARQGIDIYVVNPCNVLPGGFAYSPLWLAASGIPLSTRDTMAVGWCLDLLFISSLCFLPPVQRKTELALMLAAALSTMVVFALERANFDILLFALALGVGLSTECRASIRLIGYCLTVVAAFLKYYPLMILIGVFRERLAMAFAVCLIIAGALVAFWAVYHVELAKELPNIPGGPYNTDLFAAKNLPFMVGEIVEQIAAPSTLAAPLGRVVTGGLYAALVASGVILCRQMLRFVGLRTALAALPNLERTLLVIGSAVISGCFFAGQSIGYRGVFFLLVLPGLLALSRSSGRDVRKLALGASILIVLLMWSDCVRLAIDRRLEHVPGFELMFGNLKILFWLIRELGWWWTVSFMLAVLVDFLWVSPVVRMMFALGGRLVLRTG
jgi:hypothetical protein